MLLRNKHCFLKLSHARVVKPKEGKQSMIYSFNVMKTIGGQIRFSSTDSSNRKELEEKLEKLNQEISNMKLKEEIKERQFDLTESEHGDAAFISGCIIAIPSFLYTDSFFFALFMGFGTYYTFLYLRK